MMTLGLAVSASALRLVAVRGSSVIWAGECARDESPLASQLARLIATLPVRRWPRPRVVVAVGPSVSQVKRISGLPPLTDMGALTAVVREGAGRFFLRNGIPLVTTGVRVVEPGIAWSAAIEQPAVAEIEQACDAARLRLVSIVPALVVLGRALQDRNIVWGDGDARSVAEFDRGVLARTTRYAGNEPAAPPTPVRALASLGDGAWRYADAYGAAVHPPADAMAVRRDRGETRAPVAAWRPVVAGAACALAVLAALSAPIFAARRAERTAVARVATLARTRAVALGGERELASVTGALAEVAAFDATRRPATTLIAAIARALPEGSALVALRTDTATGTAVVLAPQSAALLARLEKSPSIVAPEMAGPVTREAAGAAPLERVTVRFRLSPATPERR